MTENKHDSLAIIGGALVLVAMICPFCAVWIASYRLEFALTAIWAAMLVYILVKSIKPVKKIARAEDALIFVEHIEKHLRKWEKDKKIKPNSLRVMCKICNKPIDEIVKEKGAS